MPGRPPCGALHNPPTQRDKGDRQSPASKTIGIGGLDIPVELNQLRDPMRGSYQIEGSVFRRPELPHMKNGKQKTENRKIET